MPPPDAVSVARATCGYAFALALALAVLGYTPDAIAALIAAITAAVTTAYVRMVRVPVRRTDSRWPVRRTYLGRRVR